jgi:hypothetical protein
MDYSRVKKLVFVKKIHFFTKMFGTVQGRIRKLNNIFKNLPELYRRQ